MLSSWNIILKMEKNTFVILSFVVLLAAENYYARVVQSYDEMELKRTYYVDGNLMDNKQIYDCNSELGVVFQKAKKSKVSIKLYFASDSGYTDSYSGASFLDFRVSQIQRNAFNEMANFYLNSLQK